MRFANLPSRATDPKSGPVTRLSNNISGGFEWFLDILFGYDFFISYSHSDGLNYPKRLFERLSSGQFRYRVFLDANEYVGGNDLEKLTPRRVRMSWKLVLVARPASLNSVWVTREVAAALKAGRDPVVIDINQSYSTAPLTLSVPALLRTDREIIWIDESLDDAMPFPGTRKQWK